MGTPILQPHRGWVAGGLGHRGGRNPDGVGDDARREFPEVAACRRNLGLWDTIPMGLKNIQIGGSNLLVEDVMADLHAIIWRHV